MVFWWINYFALNSQTSNCCLHSISINETERQNRRNSFFIIIIIIHNHSIPSLLCFTIRVLPTGMESFLLSPLCSSPSSSLLFPLFYANFFDLKNFFNIVNCQTPAATNMTVWKIDHHKTAELVASDVSRNSLSRCVW